MIKQNKIIFSLSRIAHFSRVTASNTHPRRRQQHPKFDTPSVHINVFNNYAFYRRKFSNPDGE